MGLAAGSAGAVSASADPTGPCVEVDDHVISAEADPGSWYMDCVPQYGLGKGQFEIVPSLSEPTEEFPDDFADLDDQPPVTTSTTLDAAALGTYFGDIEPLTSPIIPFTKFDATPSSQSWAALILAPITGVGEFDELTAPPGVIEQCDTDTVEYGGGWYATYGATDTTFSQTVDGQSWDFQVSGTPLPTYFFGSFAAGEVDETEPWCVTDGVGFVDESNVDFIFANEPTLLFEFVYHGIPDVEEEVLGDFGTFQRYVATPPAPALAATGSDPALPLIIGGFAALAGTALVLIAGRRRIRA